MKIKTIDMSGFGGGYEHTMQLMLRAGLEFLEQHPEVKHTDMRYHGYEGTEIAQKLESHIIKASNGDCTGAQFGCVLGHLFAIRRMGREEWLKKASESQVGRIFEWDGTEESCPKTELSEKFKRQRINESGGPELQ